MNSLEKLIFEKIDFSNIEQQCYESLVIHEAKRQFPYNDRTGKTIRIDGKITIGIGRNLTDRGLSEDEIRFLFSNDIKLAIIDLISIFPDFITFSLGRKVGLINLCFNLGKTKLLKFKDTIRCIREKKWKEAGENLRSSLWYSQVGERRGNDVINFIVKG